MRSRCRTKAARVKSNSTPSKEIMKRRHFQSRVGSSLILVNADVNHKHGRLSIDEQRAAKSARKKARKGPCPDAQLDAVGHWPEKTEKCSGCALCTTGYIDTACQKCTLRFCFSTQRNCFKQYHGVWTGFWCCHIWLWHYFEFYRISIILWPVYSAFFILIWFLLCIFISQAQNCSLTVMYWDTAYWTAYMNWFLTLPY